MESLFGWVYLWLVSQIDFLNSRWLWTPTQIHSVVVQRRKDPRQRLSRARNRNINSFIMLMNVSLFSQLACPHNAQIQCGHESDIKTSKPCSGYIALPLWIQPPASSPCSVSHDQHDLHEYLTAPLPCSFWLANGKPGRKGNVKSEYLSPLAPSLSAGWVPLHLEGLSVYKAALFTQHSVWGFQFQELLPPMTPPGLEMVRKLLSYWPIPWCNFHIPCE